jgi:hypothetical protein
VRHKKAKIDKKNHVLLCPFLCTYLYFIAPNNDISNALYFYAQNTYFLASIIFILLLHESAISIIRYFVLVHNYFIFISAPQYLTNCVCYTKKSKSERATTQTFISMTIKYFCDSLLFKLYQLILFLRPNVPTHFTTATV